MFKWIIPFLFFNFALGLEIDDSTFFNKEKYVILKNSKIGKFEELNLNIKFIPPTGKKVNKASFVRIWEKKVNIWKDLEYFELDSEESKFYQNNLTYTAKLKNRDNDMAIEVDFIHCDYSGGQCNQERYLKKLKRTQIKANNVIKLVLKI